MTDRAEMIRRIVDQAPPFTDAQRTRLRPRLAGTWAQDRQGRVTFLAEWSAAGDRWQEWMIADPERMREPRDDVS